MKKRNKQPYIEIIDLKSEQEEYVKLCDGKSCLYLTYTSWETHISELLNKFDKATDLYNFKRYCINQDRVFLNSPEMFGSYMILLVTLVLGKIDSYLSILGLATFLFYFMWYGISRHKSIIKGSCFYKDIIEIIEKVEKEKWKQ